MKPLLLLALLLGVLCLSQCNRTSYTADTFPEDHHLAFGSGGGFAGKATTHFLLPSGQIFRNDRIGGAREEIHKIGARKALKLMKQVKDDLQEVDYNQPANQYQFIQLTTPDTTFTVQWGVGAADAPLVAKQLYETLLDLLPKH